MLSIVWYFSNQSIVNSKFIETNVAPYLQLNQIVYSKYFVKLDICVFPDAYITS